MNAIALLPALLVLLSVLAFVLRMRRLEERIERVLSFSRQDRDPSPQKKQHDLRPMLGDMQNEIATLRKTVDRVLSEAVRLRTQQSTQQPFEPPPPPPIETPEVFEDGVTQLIAIANRNLRQTSGSLDAFRAKVAGLATRVWAHPAENNLQAFVVEHRGVCYAIPNVAKPGRLPEAWFNRSDFGFNDEIRDVITLPRLVRRGDKFDVEEPGEFER